MFYARVGASAAGCPSRWLHPPRGFATPGTPPAAPSTSFNAGRPRFVTGKNVEKSRSREVERSDASLDPRPQAIATLLVAYGRIAAAFVCQGRPAAGV
jgi:hypothetical protein